MQDDQLHGEHIRSDRSGKSASSMHYHWCLWYFLVLTPRPRQPVHPAPGRHLVVTSCKPHTSNCKAMLMNHDRRMEGISKVLLQPLLWMLVSFPFSTSPVPVLYLMQRKQKQCSEKRLCSYRWHPVAADGFVHCSLVETCRHGPGLHAPQRVAENCSGAYNPLCCPKNRADMRVDDKDFVIP